MMKLKAWAVHNIFQAEGLKQRIAVLVYQLLTAKEQGR